MKKKINSGTLLYGGPKLLHGSIGTNRKTNKMTLLIMYRLWSKCVPMNLKRIPMTLKIKLTHNFGPLSITFSLRCLSSAKMAIFCVFGPIGY